jgi:hypothetical protein
MSLLHFPLMTLASFVVFIGVLFAALNRERRRSEELAIVWVAAIVTIGGMTFAKAGAMAGLPVWLYYGIPAAVTWLLPPVVFRMRWKELAIYLPLAVVSAPVIHVLFSSLLGWDEYMPFLHIR